MKYRVGIIGATGAVGHELIRLLEEREYPIESLRLFASRRSVGKGLDFGGRKILIEEASAGIFSDLDLAIFSVPSGTSKALAPVAVGCGCVVVDNTSAFRMDPDVPLVVPEINAHALESHSGIIANPNCTTAVALMGLYPLHKEFGLKRFFAATYQAVSGTGAAAIRELEDQTRAWTRGEAFKHEVYPHPIAFNLLPHVDVLLESGYTKEEEKMLKEGRKILEHPNLRVSTTCVRVPVFRCHAVAISAEFERPVDVEKGRTAISEFGGTELFDDVEKNQYPMPVNRSEKVDCAVGRLRKDSAFDNGLALWVVGDQLWKGAALNAIQIAEVLDERSLLRCPARARNLSDFESSIRHERWIGR